MMITTETIKQVADLNKASLAAQNEIGLRILDLMTEKSKIADLFDKRITDLFDGDIVELAHEMAISDNPDFEPLGGHRINSEGFSISMNDGFDNVWISVPFERLADMTA